MSGLTKMWVSFPPNGTNTKLFRSHFSTKNECHLKRSQICPILCQFDPISGLIWQPWSPYHFSLLCMYISTSVRVQVDIEPHVDVLTISHLFVLTVLICCFFHLLQYYITFYIFGVFLDFLEIEHLTRTKRRRSRGVRFWLKLGQIGNKWDISLNILTTDIENWSRKFQFFFILVPM